ncbi:site-specific integrase [Rhodobacteraceae bacterium S2214]|nr:site-specific integrase [Rhodobacteraceae bacterium S2214]
MAGHTRLYRRGAVYYHRAAIPNDIKETYPKAEEVFSLKTKDHAEALQKVRVAAVEVDQRFANHRRELAREQADVLDALTPDQINSVRDAYYRHLLEEDEEVRLDGFVELGDDGNVIGALPDEPLTSFAEHGEQIDNFDKDARHLSAQGKSDPFWDGEVDEVLSWSDINLKLAPASPDRKRLAQALQQAVVLASKDTKARQQGDVVLTPPAPAPIERKASLMSSKVSEWVEEKSRSDWGIKSQDDHRHWLAVFIEIVGERPYTDYGKADGLRFKSVLSKLPANIKKLRETRDLPLLQAVDKAQELGLEPISISTYNKAMVRVGSFFGWLAINTIEEISNPVDKLRLRDKVSAKDKRAPISQADLTTLFSSPVWRTCHSARLCARSGNFEMTSHWKFWLPMIAVWTGARSNEIGQLLISDIKTEDGVDYLHIVDEMEFQRTKSNASRRKVPIHSQLKQLGLLELVSERASAADPKARLFPDLKVGAKGYFSENVTKFFSPYMEKIDIKTSKTSFHSLRHSFQDACRRAKVYQGHGEAIAGREEGGTGGAYGGEGYDVSELNASLQLISYPSVDWTSIPAYRSGHYKS